MPDTAGEISNGPSGKAHHASRKGAERTADHGQVSPSPRYCCTHRYLRARPHCLGHPASRCRSRHDRNGGARPSARAGTAARRRDDQRHPTQPRSRPATRSAPVPGVRRAWARARLAATAVADHLWTDPVGAALGSVLGLPGSAGVRPIARSACRRSNAAAPASRHGWCPWARCCPSPRPVRSSPR